MNEENEQKACEILDELLSLSGREFTDAELDAVDAAYARLISRLVD